MVMRNSGKVTPFWVFVFLHDIFMINTPLINAMYLLYVDVVRSVIREVLNECRKILNQKRKDRRWKLFDHLFYKNIK